MADLIRAASSISAALILCFAIAANASDLLASNGSALKWNAPVAGPAYDLKDGVARISIPQRDKGYNHWIGPVTDAPMLTAPAPAGDWDLTGRIDLDEYGKTSDFHVGLMAGFSNGFVCTFGPFANPGQHPEFQSPLLWLETTGIPVAAKAEVECSSIYLKLSKRDKTYTGYHRKSAGGDWIKVGEYIGVYPPEFVGVIAKTFSSEPGITFSVRDLNIEAVPETTAREDIASITVDASKIAGHIDRNIYGQFVEHMQRCVWSGLWAELLWNRKFTGGSNDHGLIESWEVFGEGAKYAPDNRDFYTSCQSQRIDLATGQEAGIIKTDAKMGIKPGNYIARAVLQQKGLKGGVRIALRQGGNIYASAVVPEITGKWAEYSVELSVKEADPNAQFSISATGPGTLWIGCLSLMPANNVGGINRDVFDAVKRMNPPNIRWPGGNMVSGYHWMDGIGNPDKRMPRLERAWNAWEWNDLGTDEFIAFCRKIGTEPYICVNAGEGNADEAAHWVEYCNGAPNTPYGKLRAANGHPEPYRVKYWGIGNEMYGDWQLGHLGAAQYALKSIEFAKAMRAVDGSIKLVGVGVPGDSWGHWNRIVARTAGSYYDYIAVHDYRGLSIFDSQEYNYVNIVGSAQFEENMLAETSRIVDEAAGKRLPLAFDEWNVWFPGEKYEVRDGIFAAGVLQGMQRLGYRVTMANLAQLVNVLGAIHTRGTQMVETPMCKAFELYSNLCYDNRCAIDSTGPSFDTPAGRIPTLDVCATISNDRKKLALTVINRDPLSDVAAKLNLEGFKAGGEAEIAVLNGPTAYSANSFDAPNTVGITRLKTTLDPSKPYVFEAHSVTVITVKSAAKR